MKKHRIIFLLSLMLLVLSLTSSHGKQAQCGKKDMTVHSTIKYFIKYYELPKEVKRLMKEIKCDVKTGSNYDDGESLDLNEDHNSEFAFCCMESSHGPCGMAIFGKVKDQWKVLLPFMKGFAGEDDFIVLSDRDEGYHRICQEGTIYNFHGGKYRKVQ